MKPFETKGYNQYGASMGRRRNTQEEPTGLRIDFVPLDSGGYDPGGAYWGTGDHLYCAWNDDGFELYYRANNLKAFRQSISIEYPEATFEQEGITTAEPEKCARLNIGLKIDFVPKINLDEMLDGYLKAAIWTTTAESVALTDCTIDHCEPDDFTPKAKQFARETCTMFAALANEWLSDELSASRVGHDFWLTRNGHGAGFWDSPELYGDEGAKGLSQVAERFGESYVATGDEANDFKPLELD